MTEYLRETRGLPIQIDNVLITRGSTMGIHLAARGILQPGDVLVVGEISYGSGNLIFKNAAAKLVTVPVDEQGLDVEAIAGICETMPVRMVYVTPHHHYPTTATTFPAEAWPLQLAKQYGFCILEDDYDYDFHYDCNPILPLAGADADGHVVYVGSLCKAISPALRVGYVVAPAEVIEELARLRRIIDRQGDNLLEATIALAARSCSAQTHGSLYLCEIAEPRNTPNLPGNRRRHGGVGTVRPRFIPWLHCPKPPETGLVINDAGTGYAPRPLRGWGLRPSMRPKSSGESKF